MNKINFVILIALVPLTVLLVWWVQREDTAPFVPEGASARKVFIDNVPITVEIADSDEERTQGLSGRRVLPENHGLLFVFDEPGAHGIWMKDMQFAIDIIWIAQIADTSSSGGGEVFSVVDIKREATPDSFPEVFFPRQSAHYVLEVNAGFTEVHGIEVGDVVRFSI